MAGYSSIDILNQSGATLKWRVNYNGGESQLSGDVLSGTSNTISLNGLPGLAPGNECWPLLEPDGGKNHECGTNVQYDPAGGSAVYAISGGVDNLSCQLES